MKKIGILTLVERLNAAAKGELIGSDDASKDSEKSRCQPPAKRVTKEVDLLAGIILGPEGDTTEQERPRDRLGSVRVRAGQSVVVVEHGALKFDVLAKEGQVLDLLHFLLVALILFRKRRDVIDEPDIAALLDILVSVNLCLLVRPLGKRRGMRHIATFVGTWISLK